MALTWPPKDPDEVLDYQIDWSDRLSGDTLLTSDWTISGDDSVLVEDSNSISGDSTIIWLSAGTLAETYDLLNRVTTTGGRTMDQTVKLKIRSK
jgi:hypothetical protein